MNTKIKRNMMAMMIAGNLLNCADVGIVGPEVLSLRDYRNASEAFCIYKSIFDSLVRNSCELAE
jgi:hypothetical protein